MLKILSAHAWLPYALGSAFSARSAGPINSNLATFIRTVVILIFAGVLISLRHEWQPLGKVPRFSLFMLTLSGVDRDQRGHSRPLNLQL